MAERLQAGASRRPVDCLLELGSGLAAPSAMANTLRNSIALAPAVILAAGAIVAQAGRRIRPVRSNCSGMPPTRWPAAASPFPFFAPRLVGKPGLSGRGPAGDEMVRTERGSLAAARRQLLLYA